MFLKSSIIIVLSFVFCSAASASATHATCEEAKALSERAAKLIKEKGAEEAFKAFGRKSGGFIDRDLYVFVHDLDLTMTFHPFFSSLIEQYIGDLRDVDGKYIARDIATVMDRGWIAYKYQDPNDSNMIKDKHTYIVKEGNYRVGVGCYHNRED